MNKMRYFWFNLLDPSTASPEYYNEYDARRAAVAASKPGVPGSPVVIALRRVGGEIVALYVGGLEYIGG